MEMLSQNMALIKAVHPLLGNNLIFNSLELNDLSRGDGYT